MVRKAKRRASAAEWKVFDAFEAGGFGVTAQEETEKQDDVGEGEKGEGDPEVEE